MPFPTVKSNPWEKKTRTRVRRFFLWSGTFWTKLVRQAMDDWERGDRSPISQNTFHMIGDMNELLYGSR